ncbi:glycosyltransferase family 2 protein [Nitrosomonas sp.]|uniref:glycosyltransferase family 2 protein n=1 Tax=Nitrosomonas sp. TaxID=42353 RepID=UPI00262D0CA3|nr:glycosyltransferase family 2 protein [Nitrosomonas sp.]
MHPSSSPIRCLSIVVPCFNEGDGVDAFFSRLESVLIKLQAYDYEIICIDDGSFDNTLEMLCRHAVRNPRIVVLELSRNFGKEAALTAGIDAARGDAVIPLDADLQHPPELIIDMVKQWENGSDVVLARRQSRKIDHPVQRLVTQWFYRLHNWIAECAIPRDVGDFRLMDKRVVEALKRLPERRRFMKGLFAWVGFRQSIVEFVVEPRKSGRSSFSARRLWVLALEGITSFSTVPLAVWAYIGFTVAMLSLVYGCWIIIKTLLFGIDVPGYASLLTAILFLGGIQLMGIGVLGEYIGRIYSESKQRPVYIIRQRYGGASPDA